jgi:hypothetical protein
MVVLGCFWVGNDEVGLIKMMTLTSLSGISPQNFTINLVTNA